MERSMYIFISYCHERPDSSLAHLFAQALQEAGHQVFIDTGIRWGINWVKEIRASLERSDYFLVLLSPRAASSEMVATEIEIANELAYQRGGTPAILPVRVRYPYSEPMPYPISEHLRAIQQEQWDTPEDTPRLVEKLLATVASREDWPEKQAQPFPFDRDGRERERLLHADVMPAAERAPERTAPVEEPAPAFDPRHLIIPGGAIDSSFYVERQADEEVLEAVHQPRAMVTVRGPRQTGKTSLIMRVYATLRGQDSMCRAAFVDFQALPHKAFQSLSAIWRAIAIHIADQLRFDNWDDASWQLDRSYDRQFSRFLDDVVFDEDDMPLLICFDEVDRVFDSPIGSEFFPPVRAFYNRGAMDPSWQKVRWLFGTSSEPSFFIEDLTQSPFNIGLRVELKTFTPDEVAGFASRLGLPLDQGTLERIMDHVGGHPYLVHLLLYHLARHPGSREELFDTETASRDVFRDHLHRYLIRFQQDRELAGAMKDIVMGVGCKDLRLVERLEAAGLVRRYDVQQVVPVCRLYAEFFSKEL